MEFLYEMTAQLFCLSSCLTNNNKNFQREVLKAMLKNGTP